MQLGLTGRCKVHWLLEWQQHNVGGFALACTPCLYCSGSSRRPAPMPPAPAVAGMTCSTAWWLTCSETAGQARAKRSRNRMVAALSTGSRRAGGGGGRGGGRAGWQPAATPATVGGRSRQVCSSRRTALRSEPAPLTRVVGAAPARLAALLPPADVGLLRHARGWIVRAVDCILPRAGVDLHSLPLALLLQLPGLQPVAGGGAACAQAASQSAVRLAG